MAPEDPKNPLIFKLDPNASKLLQRRRQRKKKMEQTCDKVNAHSVEGDGTLPSA